MVQYLITIFWSRNKLTIFLIHFNVFDQLFPSLKKYKLKFKLINKALTSLASHPKFLHFEGHPVTIPKQLFGEKNFPFSRVSDLLTSKHTNEQKKKRQA